MTSPVGPARRAGPGRRPGPVRGRRSARASERMRRPQPLLKQRMPSGRGAIEQPNITSGGAGVLTPRFWVMVVLTGIAAGLLGALMMAILFNVQYAAFDYHSGSLQHAVEQASAARRVGSLLIAGAFGGVAWFLLRRYTKGEPSEIDEAVWNGDGRLSFRRCLGTSVISEVVIGMGASIGREAAPKLLGGASGQRPGRLERPFGAAAAAARSLWRRRRVRRRLQRPAGRRAVHRRDPHRQHLPAGRPAGHRVLLDRDCHGVGVPARPRRLPRHPRLPLQLHR